MTSLYTHTHSLSSSVWLLFFCFLIFTTWLLLCLDFALTLPWVNSNLSLVLYHYFVDLSHDLYDLLLMPDFHYIELHHDSILKWFLFVTIDILSVSYLITARFMWLIPWTRRRWFLWSKWSCTNMKWHQFIHAYRWYILLFWHLFD